MGSAQNRPLSNVAAPQEPWALIHHALARALGSQVRASALIASALEATKLPAPPMSLRDVLRFVSTHLFSTLTSAVGEYAAFSLTETLSAQLRELDEQSGEAFPIEARVFSRDDAPKIPMTGLGSQSVPPNLTPSGRPAPLQSMFRKKQPSISGEEGRPLVLIALADPLERSWFARTLVCAGLDVRSGGTPQELAEILRSPALRVAVVDVDQADAAPVLRAIADLRPTLPLVVCTENGESATLKARSAGLIPPRVHEKTSPRQELVDCVVQYAPNAPDAVVSP